jgi:hypothetical protein
MSRKPYPIGWKQSRKVYPVSHYYVSFKLIPCLLTNYLFTGTGAGSDAIIAIFIEGYPGEVLRAVVEVSATA